MDMRHLLRQARNLDKALAQMDERLRDHLVSGSARDGAVRVRVNGAGDVLSLDIDAGFAEEHDAATLQATILEALKEATAASRAYREQQRAALTGGLRLPDF